MIEQSDQSYLLYLGGIRENSLKHILDKKIDNENVRTQEIQHSYDTDNLKILADEYKDRLSIFSSNIQSIYAKFNELEIFIEDLNTINFKFNVICLQESWITDNSDLSQIQLPGYNCIIQGKHYSEKGGLVIYIDTRFKYEVLINLNEYEYWEGQIIKVTGRGLPKEIIIGNIYRPPRMLHDQIRQFINELTVLMTNIENKNEVILAGDYNLNMLKIKRKRSM